MTHQYRYSWEGVLLNYFETVGRRNGLLRLCLLVVQRGQIWQMWY